MNKAEAMQALEHRDKQSAKLHDPYMVPNHTLRHFINQWSEMYTSHHLYSDTWCTTMCTDHTEKSLLLEGATSFVLSMEIIELWM
ncbi:unnamed protein product [Malus baccata var. baccata]